MKKWKYGVLSFFLALTLSAHGQSDKPRFNVGTLRNATYINSYFGLSLKIPKPWQAVDEEGKVRMQDSAVQAIGEDVSPQAQKDVQRALQGTTFNLLTLERADGATLILGAEKVGAGIKDTAAYLAAMKNMYQIDKATVSVGSIQSASVNGRPFATLTAAQRADKVTVLQKNYVAKQGDYMLLIILSYLNDAQLQQMTALLNSIEFGP